MITLKYEKGIYTVTKDGISSTYTTIKEAFAYIIQHRGEKK